MDSQVKTPPPEVAPKAPDAPATPPAPQVIQPAEPAVQPAAALTPPPEAVEATGALDANGLPVPIPESPDGGTVTRDEKAPEKPSKPAVTGPNESLVIGTAMVLFVALCGIALFAYSQSK